MDETRIYQISRATGSPELAAVTERLLGLLPSWFGIPETNAEYIESATRLPGFVASDGGRGGEPIGVLLYRRHFPEAAEIHLMAVAPSWHRRGVGRALVAAVEADLSRDDCKLLQVKTLGATHPDPGYAHTRGFYRAVGFLPLEETAELWPAHPCLIMVKPLPDSV